MIPSGKTKRPYSQAQRFQQIIRLLETRRLTGATVAELAELFGVSRRTIRRDLAQLSALGYHIYDEENSAGGKVWRFTSSAPSLHTLTFTLSELMTLKFCESLLSFLHGTPYEADMLSLLTKVETVLPGKIAVHLERLDTVHHPLGRKTLNRKIPEKLFRELQSALLLQQQLDMRYYSFNSRKVKSYRIDPYTLLCYEERLYLTAYVHQYGEIRHFALDRIRALKRRNERFEISSEAAAGTAARHSFGLIDDQPLKVSIRFSTKIAPYIRERIWHDGQVLTDQPDGGVILVFEAGGRLEIRKWIMSMGDDAVVLAPDSLRREIIRELKNTLTQYRKKKE